MPIAMGRFRMNVIANGNAPNEEFSWATIRFEGGDPQTKSSSFRLIKADIRCPVTTAMQNPGDGGGSRVGQC